MAASSESKRHVSYIPAIDGLRALAIAAVVVYHLDLPYLGGGFLGVDVFFVISGFVITRLLLDSLAERGELDLRGFYAARARRLLPALVTVGVAFWLTTAILKPVLTPRYLTDLPFAVSGTTNLWLMSQSSDYFAGMAAPSLLQHTWSLAVESQYYLLWPLFITFVLRTLGRSRVPQVAIALAVGSFVAYFFVIQDFSLSNQAASHVYFGADTHSLGLLLGSALGVNWIPRNLARNISVGARRAVDVVGLLGLVGLLWLFTDVEIPGSFIFSSSFPLAAVFSALLLASVVHPAGRLAKFFSPSWLRWIGQRSYGIYLWHWPIFQLTRPGLDITQTGLSAIALRVGLVLLAAELSYRYVETPVRRGVPQKWLTDLVTQPQRGRAVKLGALALSCSLGLTGAVAYTANAIAADATQSASADINPGSPAQVVIEPAAPDTGSTLPEPTASTPAAQSASPTSAVEYAVFGDSVLLGARAGIESAIPVARYTAVVGWQERDVSRAIERVLPKLNGLAVAFNLGNNGFIGEEKVRALLDSLRAQPKVVIINASVPRRWQDGNNALLAKVARDYPNLVLVDWHAAATGHPEYFVADGVHLTRAGIEAYAQAISAAIGA